MPLDMNGMREFKAADGVWRYVDHKRKLVTPGFIFRRGLRKNRNSFADRPEAIASMSERYVKLFPGT